MRYLRMLAVLGVLLIPASYAQAQHIAIGVGIGAPVVAGPAYVGVAPVCPYGYYGYYPYACAPSGFYGPDWFAGGVFIGAGPWYHGWGHPNWYRPGAYIGARFYGRPGFYHPGPAFHGGPVYHGPAGGFHGPVARGPVGGFHGGQAFHGGGGFHGGRR
jgi:hypothetical protein